MHVVKLVRPVRTVTTGRIAAPVRSAKEGTPVAILICERRNGVTCG